MRWPLSPRRHKGAAQPQNSTGVARLPVGERSADGERSGGGERSADPRVTSFNNAEELTPRLHKASKDSSARITSEARDVPLRQVSDEVLLAEVKLRNLKLHDSVTSELVQERYTFGALIGRGASASVYAAESKRSQRRVAIKVIEMNDGMNDIGSMQNELEILRAVRDRFVLSCFEIYESPRCIWLVMERSAQRSASNTGRAFRATTCLHHPAWFRGTVDGGELLEVLRSRSAYTEEDLSRLMRQLLMALRYLHSQGIVHRDVKLSNVLLTSTDTTAEVRLADFGLSARIGARMDPSDRRASKAYKGLTERWGTPGYFAPELVAGAYGPQVDAWAAGCVLFQLLSGGAPFEGSCNEELFDEIVNAGAVLKVHFKSPEWKGSVSEAATDLTARLLCSDPVKRLSPDEALEQPWIALRRAGEQPLKAAHGALKQRRAQSQLCAIWHVLDIVNALDEAGACGEEHTQPKRVLQGPLQHLSSLGLTDAADAATGSRPRVVSQTDLVEELRTTFALFDPSHTGYVSSSELAVFMKRLGFTPQDSKLKELIAGFDKDCDGRLSFTEFCELLRKAKSGGLFSVALREELNTVASAEGYVTAADVRKIMGGTRESEIEDVIAIVRGGEDDQVSGLESLSLAEVVSAVNMPSRVRREQASLRRSSIQMRASEVRHSEVQLELPARPRVGGGGSILMAGPKI